MTESLFNPNGWVTLTTDFGLSDPYVGVMKAILLRRNPEARVFDLTHGIPAYQPSIAGFWLECCWPYFPTGTIHLAVVDPGVGSQRNMVALALVGQLFIAPDNGLLDAVGRDHPERCWRVFAAADVARLSWGDRLSTTFHGRDIFAPLVADISAKKFSYGDLGTIRAAAPVADEFRVVAIDRYGNLLTNIPRKVVEATPDQTIRFRHLTLRRVATYSDAAPGTLVALINAWEMLEIACVQGNAAAQLAARLDEPVHIADR